MFARQGRPYPRAVLPDPAVIRDLVVEYLLRTFWALLVVIAALVVARAIRGAAIRALDRRRAHPNVVVLLGNLSRLAVFLVTGLVVLAIYTQGAFGWILTSVSVLGLVVGLSLQDILRNFFAGIYVLVERPFRIGDTVHVGDHEGQVEEIAFRTTHLRTADGREVVVPNATLMTSPVVNLTRYPSRSARLSVGIPADQASGEVAQRLRELLAKAEGVSDDPPPAVVLRAVADGRARYEVTVWGADRERAAVAAVESIRSAGRDWDVQGA